MPTKPIPDLLTEVQLFLLARSQVLRREPRMLGDPGEHARPDLLTVVERENEVG
jgi:hypothetical protein